MKESKIGVLQAASVIITVMISHIILNMPNYLITSTGSATILNLIYVFGISLIVFYICYKIFEYFPRKDIIDVCEYTGGKVLKTIFGTATCIYFLTILAFVIRTFAQSLVLIYFPNIDLEMVILIFVAICAIMNIFGFKAITRVTLISLPVILISIVIIFTSSASSFVPQRALPILGYGASETFLSGLGNIFAFSSMFVILFMIPYFNETKELKKVGLISLIVYFVYLLLGVIALLFLIPSITEINNTLSIYILSRRVTFGSFIQRIDAIFILIWIMSIFNYLSIAMHFALKTFQKMTNIKHKNGMVFCFSAILYTISMIPKNISDISFFEGKIYKYVSIIFVFFITTTILVFAYFKKKKSMTRNYR